MDNKSQPILKAKQKKEPSQSIYHDCDGSFPTFSQVLFRETLVE